MKAIAGFALVFIWITLASLEYSSAPDPIWFSLAKMGGLIAIALALFAIFEPHKED